jgi:hypothetical protein
MVEAKREVKIKKAKRKGRKLSLFIFCIFTAFAGALSGAAEQPGTVPKGTEGVWDPARYISLDEIKPGMEAYCLTEYGAAGIEKFAVEVVDVVRNLDPGRDAILVKGTDQRFVHTGPVAGCSGSPVYIQGRLAGAMAFAWPYSKDALYGVTPIAEMLRVGQGASGKGTSGSQVGGRAGFAFDFSRPIDFAEVDRQITTPRPSTSKALAGTAVLPCPVITSGLPAEVGEQLGVAVEQYGLIVVPGGVQAEQSGAKEQKQDVKLVPGACLAVPLVSGDISISVFGTVTETRGDKIYGFGHSFLGYGPVDLPIATGKVHTVVSSVLRSFKVASVLETVGALTADESAAVFGQVGAKAQTFPLTVRVERYNDPQKRVYNCRVANNRLLTPTVVRAAVAGVVLVIGDFPPDHMVRYKVNIAVEGFEPITFENVSTDMGLAEMLAESAGSVTMLMNNPYKDVSIKSMEYDVRILPKSIISHIWSVDLSDAEVEAGEEVGLNVVVESVLAGKKKYQFRVKIPKNLAPGKYELTVCGSQDYEQFLRKAVPHRFIAQDLPDLFDALNNALRIHRDRLYCILTLPAGGVMVEEAELPDLPATKALVLQNVKRTLRTQPYQHWLEDSIETGTIVIDKKVLGVTVQEQGQK